MKNQWIVIDADDELYDISSEELAVEHVNLIIANERREADDCGKWLHGMADIRIVKVVAVCEEFICSDGQDYRIVKVEE